MKKLVTLFLVLITCVSVSIAQEKLPKKKKNKKAVKKEKVDAANMTKAEKDNDSYVLKNETVYAFNDKSICPDDLVDNGCKYTSGTGRDMSERTRMFPLLNSCYTEPIPSYYVWDGNQIQTRSLSIDLDNCCYTSDVINYKLGSMKQIALNNKPYKHLITGYARIGGYMVTPYGPYRMTYRVYYRKVKSKLTEINQYKFQK